LGVVANDTELVFAQAMQLIRVDTPFPHEVSQDEEEHGVFEFVLGVDLFPTLRQMASERSGSQVVHKQRFGIK
jgi:hypothetical protein